MDRDSDDTDVYSDENESDASALPTLDTSDSFEIIIHRADPAETIGMQAANCNALLQNTPEHS